MGKKCIICSREAKYFIKDTSEYYCEGCAIDHFGDISMLLKVEEQAQLLKEAIKEKMNQSIEEKSGGEDKKEEQIISK